MKQQTTILNEWMANYNEKCNCNRGNIQLLYCNVLSCKDNEQKFFCTDCVVFDRKHDHERVSIKDELEYSHKEWKKLYESYRSLNNIVEENYYQHQHLIKYLENENLFKADQAIKNPAHYVDKDVFLLMLKLEDLNRVMRELDI